MMKLEVNVITLLILVSLSLVQGNCVSLGTTYKCLRLDSSGTDGCYAQGHSAYPAYTCRPCGGEEVYIISMHKGTGSNVPIHILAIHPVTIQLLLASQEIVHWKINKPDFVTISHIILTGVYNTYSSVTLKDGGYVNVTLKQRSFNVLSDVSIIGYARRILGRVTSISAVYATCGWWLVVGNPSSREIPDSVWENWWTPPDLTNCTDKLPCWIKYKFRYPWRRFKNQCDGDQFVTWYRIKDTTYYVGAILCSSSRYSLFIGTSLQETLLNIADSNHQGEDHCELVGTKKEYTTNIKVELEDNFLKGLLAFSRDDWGKPFHKVEIHSERVPRWYECGMTIPYSEKVHSENDIHRTSMQLSTGAVVGIVLAVIIGVMIIVICYCICHKRKPHHATNSPVTGDGMGSVVNQNRSELLEPSAPSFTPSQPRGESLVEEGAPPSYEDAMNYQLAKRTQTASLPASPEGL